jgi:uncharacterized Rossmann fold enzyme
MKRLDGVKVKMATEVETVAANVIKSRDRGLPMAHELPEWREKMPIALIGGGPSLVETIDEARRYQHAMLCGSVHDWAMENGVRPSWAVICDPDPLMANYLRRPSKDCRYLVASHCDDAVFAALEGQDVALWHCGGSFSENDTVWGNDRLVLVGGGCTVGTRSIVLAKIFGFQNIHLFGFDTCLQGDRHHAYGFDSYKEKDLCLRDVTEIRVGSIDGKPFQMAGYMVGQLFDFKSLVEDRESRVQFTVHGGGALAELLRLHEEKSAAQPHNVGGPHGQKI